MISFYEFWKAAKPAKEFSNRFRAVEREWNNRSKIAQEAMLRDVTEHGGLQAKKNPYFYVVDFVEPEPYNWNGHELDKKKQYVTARWNGRWGLYSVEDARRFGLEVMG